MNAQQVREAQGEAPPKKPKRDPRFDDVVEFVHLILLKEIPDLIKNGHEENFYEREIPLLYMQDVVSFWVFRWIVPNTPLAKAVEHLQDDGYKVKLLPRKTIGLFEFYSLRIEW